MSKDSAAKLLYKKKVSKRAFERYQNLFEEEKQKATICKQFKNLSGDEKQTLVLHKNKYLKYGAIKILHK